MSTPHCSFVIYLFRDLKALPLFIQDFRAFFQKFPLNYELICVIDSTPEEHVLKELKSTAPQNESWQILTNAAKIGRAQSLQKGASHARGELIIFPSLMMATPLGDLFKILQHLMSEPSMMACWGERYSKKSEVMTHSLHAALKTENTFNKILKEKNPHSALDPLCEIGGLRKTAWSEIENAPELKKSKGWFLANHCQKVLRQKNLPQHFLHIHDSGLRPTDFSLWSARWELLRQSLFETL
ncbi:glycosyltransferase [Bdellovibrio bacteriovorus]|uniref:glycosyltransferase n=1 Tax=Bdellovibrio bacteriovorus TaxID=959 RepID=UPI001C12BD2A|nr:glycosyltransferase [Bdellovibrio bacteriovorus]